jgi:hypothetical protein
MADALTLNIPDRRSVREAARRARDQARGYSISYKRLTLAFICEGVIVATSLAGAWLFATMYGGEDRVAFWMMMLAPVAYGVIEFSRVPLAVSIRTQTSLALRILAAIGVIGAAAVTIKSVSQLGEIMFRPRLQEAVRAHEKLIDAKNEQATLDKRIASADAVVAQRTAQLADAEGRLKNANTELGSLPPQRCFRVVSTDRQGRRTTGTRCSTDPRTEAMKASLSTGQADRSAAAKLLDAARVEQAALDRNAVDRRVSEAEIAHKDAIMRSQLHSFTAMVFRRDPTKVTDQEIHSFLFFFVFIPAIGASLASTLLALTAVERIEPEIEDIRIDDAAGGYILEPFADEIVRQATEAAEKTAAAALERARPAAPLRVVESGR